MTVFSDIIYKYTWVPCLHETINCLSCHCTTCPHYGFLITCVYEQGGKCRDADITVHSILIVLFNFCNNRTIISEPKMMSLCWTLSSRLTLPHVSHTSFSASHTVFSPRHRLTWVRPHRRLMFSGLQSPCLFRAVRVKFVIVQGCVKDNYCRAGRHYCVDLRSQITYGLSHARSCSVTWQYACEGSLSPRLLKWLNWDV